MIELITELSDFQIIVTTTKNLTKPIFSKLLFIYVVFYLYAILGAKLYGGKINLASVTKHSPSSPGFYYLLNFNSFSASLVTLFHFMVVNNWFVTIDMYQLVTGHQTRPLLFFISFWCFVVLILLNVLIALILEIYSSVEPEVAMKAKKVNLTMQLSQIVNAVDKDSQADRFTQVRKQLAEMEKKSNEDVSDVSSARFL